MEQAAGARAPQVPEIDFAAVFAAIPTPYLVMSRDLVIVEANAAYLANVGRTREELVGRPVFEAFPPTPDALDDSGVSRVQVSFERARDTRRLDTMPLQKYDIPDGAGRMTERYWSLISVPVLGPDGETALVVQRAEDITDFLRERQRVEDARERGETWRRRAEEVESDLFARSQELAAAVRAKELASQRLASLAEVALQLTSAETVEDLANVVFRAGLPVLGASGGSVAVRQADGDWLDVTVTPALGPHSMRVYGRIPLDSELPTARAARGQEVLVPDERAAEAYAGLPEALEITRTRAWAALPLRAGDRLLGSLSVGWADRHPLPPEEVELLRAFAAQCAQLLDRLQVRAAERQAALEVRRIAETLQRSLLSDPPKSDDLVVAVGYQPASQVAQVGGDWYDAFVTRSGVTNLVIGDVAGHDKDAAAAMAQVRNILRGIAQVLPLPPAAVLRALDGALSGLEIAVLATVVLAQLSQSEEQRARGERTLRWSNAGHPPPLLLRADGAVELLAREADLLVGLQDAERADHEVTLRPGDVVLLYTDGLVETRDGDIERDLARLRAELAADPPDGDPQALVDRLADRRRDRSDDVALLVARVQ